MKKRFFSIRFSLLTLLTFLAVQIHASGFIVIQPFPLEPLPQRIAPTTVKHHDVKVSVNKQIATTTISQTFHNPNNYEVEGTYIFPIPENVSINKFTMHVNGEPLAGQILDKDKARNIYETIVRRRKDPALLEYVGQGLIQTWIYPIAAHSDVQISFEYSEILAADNGTIKYRHTLGADKIATKGLSNVSISVNIASEKNIVNLYSPTHELSIKKSGLTNATVSCVEKNIGASRDFILYYTVPHDEIGFNILSYKEGKEDGFFLAMMSPNISKASQPVVSKNIIFVVDRSGSMGTNKMKQAKDALQFCLQNLNEEDQFNIVSFDDRIESYKNELTKANYNQIQQAVSYVDTLYARGCTNIDGALRTALKQLPKGDKPNMIIFLTDGQANVGESNVTRIVENAKKRNATNTRIFSFGVGYDVNTTLLDKISLDNKGASDYVRPSENIETVITKFYKKVANPVLTDLLLQVTGTDVKEIFPIDLPDLFHGSQLLVLGRYTKGGDATVQLSGKQNTTEKEYIFSTQFTENDTSNDFLPRLWATRKIAYLIDTIILEGKNKSLVDEIVKLSKKYGIITQYTSFLVDANAEEFSKETVSSEMMDMTFNSLCFAAEDQVGESAVSRAKNHDCLRKSSTVCTGYTQDKNGTTTTQIRTMHAKTFFLKNKVWIDSDHTDSSPITKIKLFSKAYFELLRNNPDISGYLSLGKNVIIKTNTGSIEIYDDSK